MNANGPVSVSEEVTFKTLLYRLLYTVRFLAKHWLKIVVVGLIGAAIGFYTAGRQPVKYIARLTFVLEESKSAVGGLASLAGQFGVDLGASGGGGIFNGDNILLFLKSESLVRETMLTTFPGTQQSLADRYVASYNLKEAWSKKVGSGNLVFSGKNNQLGRVEDSLLQGLVSRIAKTELEVSRPDKKASFIEVKTAMRDEALSKIFCDRLVEVALEKYVRSKVKVKAGNVKMLQRRADSLESILNARTYTAAATQQTFVDLNPGLRAPAAQTEIRNRDKMTAAAIYTEVVKNLELAKTILNQETPTIEIVDTSTFPLKKEKASRLLGMITWSVVLGGIMVAVLLFRRWWMSQN